MYDESGGRRAVLSGPPGLVKRVVRMRLALLQLGFGG